jgi:hypothetical protein
MKYSVVTTFNQSGYKQYGQRMIQTFLAQWPAEVDLVVYAENCAVTETAPNLTVRDISVCTDLVAFKQRWQGVPKANGDVSQDPVRSLRRDAGKGFKWDAVRFAHKVYSIFHCAQNTNADILIWMDGDTVCHSRVTIADLQRLCPEDSELGFLGRRGKFSECGLYSMNLGATNIQQFLTEFQRMYDDAEQGIFTLDEWHDSYVWDQVRKRSGPAIFHNLNRHMHAKNLSGHPFINSALGNYMDHAKGNRKKYGHSLSTDIQQHQDHPYWKQILQSQKAQ